MTSLRSGVKLTLMKKISLYIFLVLMWCNVGVADEKIYWCQSEYANLMVEEGEPFGIPISIIPEENKIIFLIEYKSKDGSKWVTLHFRKHFFEITEKNSNFYKAYTPEWDASDKRRVDLTFNRETNELFYKFEDLDIISKFFCNSDL